MIKVGNIHKDNFELIIKYSDTDDFSKLLIMNGLYVRNGGTPINFILDNIIPPIREKLSKKYKTIKPGDIKNKIKIYLNIRFFPNLEFTSQEKVEISNPYSHLRKFFGNRIDFDKLVKKILKDEDIILSITEYFELKEKAKQNAELKKLKKEKKFKSEKFYPSINRNEILMICEGQSARSSLMNILGRDNIAYYELKGVPLNAWDLSLTKVLQNQEMKELLQIYETHNFNKIVIASDSDADGAKISLLLVGNIYKLLQNYKDKIYRFYTPIMAKYEKGKIKEWYYNINKSVSGNIKYLKGLGSWNKKDLQNVIKKDGFDNMIKKIDPDKDILDDWLNTKKTDKRKEMINQYELDINKI